MTRFRILAAITILATSIPAARTLRATAQGAELHAATSQVEQVLANHGTIAPYTRIYIEEIRDSTASIAYHDIALYLDRRPSRFGTPGAYLSNHHPRAVQAIAAGPGRECHIFASAQAFDDPTTSIGTLPASFASPVEAWTYALLHETAHCSWNPALRMTQYLNAHEAEMDNLAAQALLFDLAQQVGESYADTYAVFMLKTIDPVRARSQARAVLSWRDATSSPRAVHHTTNAIACAVATPMEKVFPEKDYKTIHSEALRCAFAGARAWLSANRVAGEDGERYLDVVRKMADLPKQQGS